jgi:hypothetical protein
MTVPEVACFYIGILVQDIETTIANYNRILGDEH